MTRGVSGLLLPAFVVFATLLVFPAAAIVQESFREFVPGYVGSSEQSAFTLANYAELLTLTYLRYFLDTFRIGLAAALLGVTLGFPIAYFVARLPGRHLRRFVISLLIAVMFLSSFVRVYALQLSFGQTGLLKLIAHLLGTNPNSRTAAELLVIAGLLHYVVPLSALTLIGTVQNVNPHLVEVAQSLGAARWIAHFTVTLPLSLPGLLSAFLISFTLCISSFVVPMILGKGRVLFVSNLIYSRFSEVANFPSGAAISIVMLGASLIVIAAISRIAGSRGQVV